MVECTADMENNQLPRSISNVAYDHPLWSLLETNNSFTITPMSEACVQASLTIDKVSLKAQEHGK